MDGAAAGVRAAAAPCAEGRPLLNERVSGVLLVGGRSRRFGAPKALATLEGETLAARAWRTLAWCEERLAVGKAADGLPLPFPVVDDASSIRAPLVGVVAGLRAARHELAVVLPVDCPLVTPELLHDLVAAVPEAAVPQTGPLPGAFRRGLLPLLERRLTAGELSLRDALAEVDAVAVVPCDPQLLVNVNTERELRELGPP